jgi:hypothetical protein
MVVGAVLGGIEHRCSFLLSAGSPSTLFRIGIVSPYFKYGLHWLGRVLWDASCFS